MAQDEGAGCMNCQLDPPYIPDSDPPVVTEILIIGI